jgi:hypothetical protein
MWIPSSMNMIDDCGVIIRTTHFEFFLSLEVTITHHSYTNPIFITKKYVLFSDLLISGGWF